MSDQILAIRSVRHGKRVRECYWCDTSIITDDPYIAVIGIWDGRFSAVSLHEDCEEAWKSDPCNRDGDGCIYEHERGKRCDESREEPPVRHRP